LKGRRNSKYIEKKKKKAADQHNNQYYLLSYCAYSADRLYYPAYAELRTEK